MPSASHRPTLRPALPPPLQPGGYLLSLGPLQYHWADAHRYLRQEELSVELSLEEVAAAAGALGFRTLRSELVPASFLRNQRSMLQNATYQCAWWTLQKPEGGRQQPAPPA